MIKFSFILTRQLLSSVLLASLVLTACSRSEQGDSAGAAPPALPVAVLTLQSNQVEEGSEFVGSLEAADKVTLQPQTQGRIQQILVSSGDRVNKGTLIAALSIDQTQADVTTAQAGVSSARAAVTTAQAQLQAAQADRTKSAAELELQRKEYQRTERLVTEGAQARQQLDIAQRDLDAASASLTAADKQTQAAQAAVFQAEAAVDEAQSRVSAANVDRDFKQVTAPIDGVIGDLPVKVGDYVTPETTLTTITRNSDLDMRIPVPSNYASQLRTGLPVQLIDPTTKTQLSSGSIYFISPQIDAAAQSILTKARFPNPTGNLRDGQSVQAKIVWRQSSDLLVPTTAITRLAGQAFVYVVEQKQTESGETQTVVSQRPVTLGAIQDNSYVVTEGLKLGEQVATSNILKLRDGAPVQPQTAETASPQTSP